MINKLLYSGNLIDLKKNQTIQYSHISLKDDLNEFPSELYSFKESLVFLDLSGNNLNDLPDDFLVFDKLEILFLSNNQFEVFPEILSKCKSLRMIGIKANKIHSIPEYSFPEKLQWLTLTDNLIQILPNSIGGCKELQKLILSGNKLKTIPQEISRCENLELVRIAANCLEEFPLVLFELPKLTWLAYSGNPFCSQENEIDLPKFDWTNFEQLEELGNGASGVIYKVKNSAEEVFALKVFKGGMTSDGSPLDELYHYDKVGNHQNLVALKGEVSNYIEAKKAVLFDLIPKDYVNLGNPPSLVSCSRDVMSIHHNFTYKQVLFLLNSIASVSKLMHEKGVMHGDLYAHNILVNKSANCFLGDFGAASSYVSVNDVALFEKIEVRAFGVLIEDVMQVSFLDLNEKAALEEIKFKCLDPTLSIRPTFEQLIKMLKF